MNELSIVCCYNNKKLYNNLKKDIDKQSVKVDLIGIDNCNNKFSSCSSAYNSVIKSLKTKYVLFLHQDIVFLQTNNLEKILSYLKKINDYDLLGLVGSKKGETFVSTNVYVGDTNHFGGSNRVFEIERTETLDECIFGGYTKCFSKYPFDEKICDNWHLYAVERCLAALVRGDNVFVCDVSVLHLSSGNVDINFDKSFVKLCRKYHNIFREIRTPCAISKTSNLNLWFWKCKSKLKRRIKS